MTPTPVPLYTVNIITDVFNDGSENWRMRITLAGGASQEFLIDAGQEIDATTEARRMLREQHGLRCPPEA